MRRDQLTFILIALCPFSFFGRAVADTPRQVEPISISQNEDTTLMERIDRAVQLTEAQRPKVKLIAEAHELELNRISGETTLTKASRETKLRAETNRLLADLKATLTADQLASLQKAFHVKSKPPYGPRLSITYSRFYPSGAEARAIFGSFAPSVSFGLFGSEPILAHRTAITASIDSLDISNNGNQLFLASPQVGYAYLIPITGPLSAYTRISAGPSYMDYTFDTPGGEHLGAKRFGVDGAIEAGIRYGRVLVSATYRTMTQPAGINFNSLQLSALWTVVTF